ncbi:glycosyltransferase [Kerstersia gyiorum]|uniref:glycosyltransferase n=1 Tax=Kerstersia gyiorum TaxID=206506 RepID=UPI00209E6298|nr:glycosyltransferase [Kerstersia gyiorum]MCP1670218.1 glycosyltransferase involved in cell wall biosynthesis [Kerstersia gyiorum]MCP1708125.1 glycosyltransferase involved in cell wall biosynthesis [Kerstersia gyiorum]
MKILFVTTGLGLGGAERQVCDLADRLVAAGHDVAIAYMVDGISVRPGNEAVRLIPLHCKKTPVGLLQGFLRLRRLVREVRPDVVHSHMVHANILTRLARIGCRMPRLICTAHNTNEGGRIWMYAYRWTDRLADVTTNVSKEAVKVFEEKGAVPPGRMVPIYNGIDVEQFAVNLVQREQLREQMGVEPHHRLLLALGRLVHAKGHDILIDVFARMAGENDNLRLWIAGEGELRQALQQQINAADLQNKVLLLGARSDVPALLNAADVFVLPSRFEGFGLVVAEAMACTKPVVATDAGGVAEVMGGHGWLVPVEAPERLRLAVEEALTLTREQLAVSGQQARQHIVDNFGIDAALRRWLDLYQTGTVSL